MSPRARSWRSPREATPRSRSGALRARGLALEIGPDELRLDEAEARQLLRAAGLDLAHAEVAELTEHTEGWTAGLYLAAISAKASGAGVEGATGFRGDDHFLADYLRSELLSQLPRDELRFLTRTAVLERMAGPLCDAVLESSDSAAELAALERSNLFVVALDRNEQWYRYHHLFQELLRSELERGEPELVPQLLSRASHWCEANGQPETAIRYAQAAGDVAPRGATGRAQCATDLPQRPRRDRRRLARMARGPTGATEPDAAVAVIGGLIAALWGRPAEAERWADAAERATYDGALPDGSASIDSWLALLRARAVSSRGREDARRRRGRRRDARPREPVPAERAAGARDRRTGWPARSTRPTTCSPTPPRKASSWASPPR